MFSGFNNLTQFVPAPRPHDEARTLFSHYRELVAMDDQPVERGNAFNGFLASLLHSGGLETYSGERGLDRRDEIDVAFSFEQRHFILEAKWLADKANDDAIQKLRGRLDVRLPGTVGFFVSMKGYTQPALDKAKFVPGVILLDHTHVEALVTGLLTPPDFVHRALSWATRRGGSYPSLDELLSAPSTGTDNWLPPQEAPKTTFQSPGVTAAVVLAAAAGTALTGVTAHGDSLLLTTGHGVHRLDPATGQTRRILALPGSRDAAHQAAANTTVLREAAVVTCTGSTGITPLAGPFPTMARLLADSDGQRWVFATTGPPGYGGRHTLTRLGRRPTEQQEHTIDFVGKIDNMALLPGNRLYLVGGVRAGVLDIQQKMAFPESGWERAAPVSEITALLPWGTHTMLSAGRSSDQGALEVYSTDLRTHAHTLLLAVDGQRVVALAPGKYGHVHVIIDAWLPSSALPRPVLFALTLPETTDS